MNRRITNEVIIIHNQDEGGRNLAQLIYEQCQAAFQIRRNSAA